MFGVSGSVIWCACVVVAFILYEIKIVRPWWRSKKPGFRKAEFDKMYSDVKGSVRSDPTTSGVEMMSIGSNVMPSGVRFEYNAAASGVDETGRKLRSIATRNYPLRLFATSRVADNIVAEFCKSNPPVPPKAVFCLLTLAGGALAALLINIVVGFW